MDETQKRGSYFNGPQCGPYRLPEGVTLDYICYDRNETDPIIAAKRDLAQKVLAAIDEPTTVRHNSRGDVSHRKGWAVKSEIRQAVMRLFIAEGVDVETKR